MKQKSLLNPLEAHPAGSFKDRLDEPPISLSAMLKRGAVMIGGEPRGRIEDVIVQSRVNQFAPVTGIIVRLGKSAAFVPIDHLNAIHADTIEIGSQRWNFSPFVPRDGEISLKTDVLCQRVIDISRSALVRAYDVRLASVAGIWAAVALDVHRNRIFAFGSHASHSGRDWRNFIPLGHVKLPVGRSSPDWIGRLRPAQIADLIEAATAEEQEHLLAQVHDDPELEADVFEELEEESQAQLFKSLSDSEVAEVLARMRADDAADAIMELSQDRRQLIVDLLPVSERNKVLTLLGYNEATAGGLMGTEFLALPEHTLVREALEQVRTSRTHQPEALVTIHSLAPDGRLAGTLGLVQALQFDPEKPLQEAVDPNIVAALPEDDILAVVNRMADFNLLSLPVIDHDGRMIGVVTVDDALEAAIPKNWTSR